MRNIVVVTFEEPGKAYRALGEMKTLHGSGRISLHSGAVVERFLTGEASVRDYRDRFEPVSRPHGLVSRLIDGLAGTDEMLEIASHIPPGQTGVIAEVGEEHVDVLDISMRQLDGKVFRASTDEVKAAFSAAEDALRNSEMKVAKAQMAAAEKQVQADWEAALREQKSERSEQNHA